MSVLISGALINGAGVPMAECKIYLDALVNTSEVVTESFAVIETDAAGQYAFEAQKGKYTVHIKQKNGPKCCVGDISVYEDSKPGTLNDFLTALDEGDLKPDVVKRFEEMVAQAQQSAEVAAESERQAGQHAADAQQIKSDCEKLADNVQQNAEAVAEYKRQVAQLASSATQDATRAEQAVKDADKIVDKAVDKLSETATLTGEAKASAESASKSEQSAKQHRDETQRIVDDLKGTSATTAEKGLVQLSSDTDNDSEELAATPKAVKTVMDETKTKAPLDSPAFTGTPSTPTPPDDAAGNEIASAAFVRRLLAALVDSSPEALDTLNELAAALGNDPNFATTVTNALAGKQPLSDVLTAISELTQRSDNLLYFNADGDVSLSALSEKGRSLLAQETAEDLRAALELKASATMDYQSDIMDRTPGRLALSGMYGFGHAFAGTEALAFNGQADFTEWLKEATPGRYAVSIADSATLLEGTTMFNGIMDVMWSPFDNDDSDATRKFKTVLCFNQYYAGEHSLHHLTYSWSGDSCNATVSPVVYDGNSLAYLLSRTAGTSTYYRFPAPGTLILAVYQKGYGVDDGIQIGAGDVVCGSRLAPVAISCAAGNGVSQTSTPQVNASNALLYSFPGRYQALSGTRLAGGESGYLCLFVRVE